MDIATIIGFLVGLGCVLGSIYLGGDLFFFISLPSLLLVMGGITATTFIMFPMRSVVGSFKVAFKAFAHDPWNLDQIIDQMIALNKLAKTQGILALEKVEKSIDNPFLKKGLQLAVDGTEEDIIRFVMATELSFTKQRHAAGKDVFRQMGMMAPAFGMVGTLIGLVQMLRSMETPDSIGPSMALALLTTLYGALLANLVFLPIAAKLDFRSKEEALAKQVIIEGVVAIRQGSNPSVLRDKLEAFVPPSMRKNNPRL